MDKEDYQNQIERLRRTAETGEDWAEICHLEALQAASDQFNKIMEGAAKSHQEELARAEWERS